MTNHNTLIRMCFTKIANWLRRGRLCPIEDAFDYFNGQGVPLNPILSELDDSIHVMLRREPNGIYRPREQQRQPQVDSDADTEEMTDEEE